MDYLDEETLVWDTNKSDFTDKNNDENTSRWVSVNASKNHHEFLPNCIDFLREIMVFWILVPRRGF